MQWFTGRKFAGFLFAGVLFFVCPAEAQTEHSDFETLPREYYIRGTVVSVHSGAAVITIRGSNLIGYLRIRQKSYSVRRPEALKNFRPGDRIKAVYSTRDRKLYHLLHVQAESLVPASLPSGHSIDQ